MSVGIVADRYSEALFELAQESKTLVETEHEVEQVLATLNEQPDLVKFIDNPLLTADAKCQLLSKIFGDELDKSVLHFLFVMIHRNRAHYICEALQAFVDRSQEAHQGYGVCRRTIDRRAKQSIAYKIANDYWKNSYFTNAY